MKNLLKGLLLRLKTAIKPFLRVQMVISCFIPFCVVTLPAYVLPVIGLITHNAAITAVGTTWLGIIHLPICHESIVIIPIGLFIHGKLFPNDKITRYRLLRLWVQAKRDIKAVKERFKRLTKKGSGGIMAERKRVEEEQKGNKYSLPYGIAKSKGLDTTGMTPSQVWNLLKGYGVNAKKEYEKLEKQNKLLDKFGKDDNKVIGEEWDGKFKDTKEIAERLKQEIHDEPKYIEKKIDNDLTSEELSKQAVKTNEEKDDAYSQDRKNKAAWAKSQEESKTLYGKKAKQVLTNCTEEQLHAAKSYTDGSGAFNRPLRGYDKGWGKENYKGVGKVSLDNEGQEQGIKNLTNLINESSYDFDCWVQRGVNFDGAKRFLGVDGDLTKEKINKLISNHQELEELGFLSCGAAKGTGFGGNVIFNIYCPKGSKMLYVPSISKFKWENEMIIQRGTKFIVSKATKSNGGTWYIDVEITRQI